jgi:anti-anti-sigma regulatory factor
MKLTQRQINHGVFGLLTIGGFLLVLSSILSSLNTLTIVALLSGTLLSAGLWAAYWRGWAYACPGLVLLLTLLTGIGIQDVTTQFDPIIFIAPVLALILTRPIWIITSAITIMAFLLVRANGQGEYAFAANLIEYSIIIAGLVFSRLATDNAQRLAEARAQAESALLQAEQQAKLLEQQAHELSQQNNQQQNLLDLVSTLETPAIELSDGVLLVPIVGHLDSRRAIALANRLLEDAHTQRAQLVILDIAGVSMVDTAVAQSLLQTAQALRLLGCTVYISGIAMHVATALVHLGIDLEGMTPVRNPQDALARFAQTSHGHAIGASNR